MSHSFADRNCTNALSTFSRDYSTPIKETKKNRTSKLIAYLGALLEKQIIGESELNNFIHGLSEGKVTNPINKERTWIDIDALIHWEGIQEHLQYNDLNIDTLFNYARSKVKEMKQTQIQREEIRIETQSIYQKIEFYPIPKGQFLMGRGEHQMIVRFKQSFDAMSTVVTQKHWVDIMGENPAAYKNGEYSIVIIHNGKQIRLQPDNPIENITWWSAIIFANKLSEELGLKPVYDVSEIKWREGTRAEDGTLDIESGEIKINAVNEDIYLTEGYRLPTDAEQEYMLSLASPTKQKNKQNDSEMNFRQYAWYSDNAENKTHPVAQLNPLYIDKNAFFELYGNVWEWGSDWQWHWNWNSSKNHDKENPIGTINGQHRAIRGGGFNCNLESFRSTNHINACPESRSNVVGLRLVKNHSL